MSWYGLSMKGRFLQYSTPGSGFRAPLPSVGYRSRGRWHFGHIIWLVVFIGLPFKYTSPWSYSAVSVSTLICGRVAETEGSSEGAASFIAFCSTRVAAVEARAIFSSRCALRTMSWIILWTISSSTRCAWYEISY